MNTQVISQKNYASPEVNVVEVEAVQVICQSGDTPELVHDDDAYVF